MMPSLLIKKAAAETAGAAAEQGGSLPQLDSGTYVSQLFWLAICFSVLYYFMARMFLPKLAGIIEERRNRIADDYDQAAELKRQAEEAEAAYEAALADAKARASSIAAETRADLDAELAKMASENDEKLAKHIEAAEKRIDEMKEQATAKVREAALDTSKAIVEALIDETPTADAVKSAVNAV